MRLPSCRLYRQINGHEQPTVTASLHQVGGCQGSANIKRAAYDSCFSYRFSDTLVAEFCLTGNCCPDSERFALSYAIKNDTIYLTAADTAAIGCRCTCNYLVRAAFANLPVDHYVFVCKRADYSDQILLYSKDVYRAIRIQ